MSRKVRYVLLCEDRLQERFLRKVCEGLGLKKLRVACQSLDPGNAAQKVREQYPREVRDLRSRSKQRNLALLVVIDGDQHGPIERKRQLDTTLMDQGTPMRSAPERIVITVPTWSIETWLGHLNGHDNLDEQTKYKRASWFPDDRKALSRWIRSAADDFVELLRIDSKRSTAPASIQDAMVEFQRLVS